MINFPSSPTNGQQYSYYGRSWEWSTAKNAWLLVPVSTTDANFAANRAAAANASAVDAKASEDAAEVAAASALDFKNAAAISATEAATNVLSRPLTGLSLATGTPVTAVDTVLGGFGKLQKQVTDVLTSIGLLAPKANPTFTGTVTGVTKTHVGLSNVDNTADSAKPVSTAQQTALNLKANLASPTFTGTVGGITAAMVGLGNVDNTTDASKPISTATQIALNDKAPLASPTFTGTVGGITAAMVGLSNVNNTADADKPVSTAQAAAINTAKTTLELNAQTGTAYTLVLVDAGKRVSMSNAEANVLTVPTNSAAAFPVNTIIYVSQDGAGATSIAAGAGVTINTAEGLKVGGQYKMVSLIKTATDTWLGIGSVA